MPYVNVPLLVDNGQLDQTGPAVNGDAWYGFRNGLHTISAKIENFTGRLYIEATLSTKPTQNDWFPVYINSSLPFEQFPRDITAPTGSTGDTEHSVWNFHGNFTAVRARVQRSHLTEPPADLGRVIEVTLSI